MFTEIDYFEPVLDSWNYSELHDVYNQASFRQNYTISGAPSDPDTWLVIEPKNNSNFVVYVVDYEGDIYFRVVGYMVVGAFGTMGSWSELESNIQIELRTILSYVEHPELADNLVWDDDDFAMWPSFYHVLTYFGFAALILLTVFIMFFKQGLLLTNLKLIGTNISLLFGVVSLYFAIGFGLLCAWATYSGVGPDETLICWTVPATFFIVGTYLTVAETKALAQQIQQEIMDKNL